MRRRRYDGETERKDQSQVVELVRPEKHLLSLAIRFQLGNARI